MPPHRQALAVSSNIMNSSQDDDLKYYDKRIKEFDKLLSQVKSQTLNDLINTAKTETEKAVEKLVEVQRSIVIYLKAYEIKNDERLQEFGKQIDLQSIQVKKLKESNVEGPLKSSLLQFHGEIANQLNEKLNQREELRKLTFKVFTSCANDFKVTLLEKIFKPNAGQFHYETIVDVLNYIAGKFIPFLDEAKAVSNFPPAFRRKEFAKSGDKILVYLEQYIDVIGKWTDLGNKCIEIVE